LGTRVLAHHGCLYECVCACFVCVCVCVCVCVHALYPAATQTPAPASGCLIENINDLAAANHDGYDSTWKNNYITALQEKTSGGFSKLDLVSFSYHHVLGPLVDSSALAMEIASACLRRSVLCSHM
jgi:hypothetical protein